jgi:hypothetical protein
LFYHFYLKYATLIAIDNVLIAEEVITAQFVCNLSQCKGGCCEDGDAGAPLEEQELHHIDTYYETIKPYLTEEGIAAIEHLGRYVLHQNFGWVTPTISDKMCAYGYRDEQNIIKCAFEQAYNDGKTNWKKPISCHLYPIKIKKTVAQDLVNYEPREALCNAACSLGKALKMPVYVFLKDALIRKYGAAFYTVLEQAVAQYLKET